MTLKTSLLLSGLLVFLFSCNKSEIPDTGSIKDYLQLQKGKYITYRLDSTVFTNFGRDVELHAYEEKHLVDTLVTDNLGRPAWRIFRFIKDTGTTNWTSAGTYLLTNSGSTLELTEDNLRQLRLVLPLKEGQSWKGNRHFPFEPYNASFNFSNDDNIQDWDFTYTDTNESFTLPNGNTIDDVLTVTGIDESINVPVVVTTAYASINFSLDRYAKGIGLVYQEYTMWEYQPNPGGSSPYYIGFGVSRYMIDHN